ncbi:MAG TPA: O-antigen ligase family protein [Kiloniellales bacterium]|nr:O-antigen ligase family protein [Kiloniellales bacterium]
MLAVSLLPLSLLNRNASAFFLYWPLALAALFLAVPAGRPRWAIDRALLWPVLALYLWGLVSLLWTTALQHAAEVWPVSFGVALLTVVSYGTAATATDEERRLVTRALVAGFILGFLLYASEYVTDGAIYRWRYAEDNATANQASTQASAPLVLLSLVALMLIAVLPRWLRWLPALGVLVLSVLFRHWAGVIGLVAAAPIWGLAVVWPRQARRLWVPLLLAFLVVVPFLGPLLQAFTPAEADWKPRELLTREQMWRAGADLMLEKPLFGWGFAASKNLPQPEEVSLREGKRILSNHPHNAPLQLGLELGVVGILLGGWFLFRLHQRLQSPVAQALLMYILVQAAISAGLWPSRWLSMACVGVVLYRLVAPAPVPARPSS